MVLLRECHPAHDEEEQAAEEIDQAEHLFPAGLQEHEVMRVGDDEPAHPVRSNQQE